MIIEKQEADYNMLDWWKKVVFKNYVNFEGRARRSELWYFRLVNFLIVIIPIALMIIGQESGGDNSPLFILGAILLALFFLGIILPSIAVSVRRLHDTNKSGWWYLIGIIPIVSYIGSLVLFVFFCTNGDNGSNQYGPNPKVAHNADEIGQIGTE